MARQAMHMVNVSQEDFERLQALRTALATRSGHKVTLASTFSRAMEALEANYANGAWLSPREAWPLMRERSNTQLFSVVCQVLRQLAPHIEPLSMQFDEVNEMSVLSYSEGRGAETKAINALTGNSASRRN